MSAVSAVEFVTYLPSVVVAEDLTSYDAVESRIAADPDGVAQLLHKYLNVIRPARSYAVDLSDTSKQSLSDLDADLLQSAHNVGYPVPSQGGEVKIRPFIECHRSATTTPGASTVNLVDPSAQSVRDFDDGRQLHIFDEARFVKARVTAVDAAVGSVSLDVELVGGTVKIVGFVSADPGRMVDIINFRDWVTDQTVVSQGSSVHGFNPELYKLLYAGIDARLEGATDEQLGDDYLSHPGRIGSVADMRSVVHGRNFSTLQVDQSVTLAPAAQVVFQGGQGGGELSGMFVSSLVADPREAIESFDNLSVTPAALWAVLTRELANLLTHVNAAALTVAGSLTANGGVVADSITVTNDASVLGDCRIGGDLVVAGASELTGDVNILGDLACIDVAASGDAHVHGEMIVDSNLTVQSATAEGHVEILSGLEVVGGAVADSLAISDGMTARTVAVTTLQADTVTTASLTAEGHIESESSQQRDLVVTDTADVDKLVVDDVTAQKVGATTASVEDGQVTRLRVTEAASMVQAVISEALTVDTITARTHTAQHGRYDVLQADEAKAVSIEAGTVAVDALVATSAVITDVSADSLEAKVVVVADVAASTLTADVGTMGTVKATRVETRLLDVASDATVAGQMKAREVLVDQLRSREVRSDYSEIGYVRGDGASFETVDTSTLSAKTIDAQELRCVAGDMARLQAGDVNVSGRATTVSVVNAAGMVTQSLTATEKVHAAHIQVGSTLICGPVVGDVRGLTLSSGVLDTKAAMCEMGVASVVRLEADHIQADNIISGRAQLGSATADDLVVNSLTTLGDVTFNAGVELEALSARRTSTQRLEVSEDTVLRGPVDFRHSDISLPERVHCRDELTATNSIKTDSLSGTTLNVSRIVIGPAGMTFV